MFREGFVYREKVKCEPNVDRVPGAKPNFCCDILSDKYQAQILLTCDYFPFSCLREKKCCIANSRTIFHFDCSLIFFI